MTVVCARVLRYAHALPMKRVLIFTAGYGEGHNAAARGLAAALTEAGVEAEVRDLFREHYGRRQKVVERLYIE